MRACKAAARPDEDRPGSEPVPGYRLVTRVGAGGAGEVWCAEAPGGLRVALKIVRLTGGLGRREMANVQILRAIRHPNLLAYFGAWQLEGRLIIGMELADRSLWDRFAEARGRGLAGIPLGELLGILGDVARVVDFLNEPRHQLEGQSGIAIHHRDIKPQNIMLIGQGVKVADFGLSCLDDSAGVSRSQCGLTFAYAAPEAFRRRVSATSDQYSLAVTFCQLRGGRLPFVGPPASVMLGHLFGDPDLSMLPELERPVVARAMAKDPSERWTDSRSFVTALAGCAEGGSPDSLPGGADCPEGRLGSSCSVQIPPLSGSWEGSISVCSARGTFTDDIAGSAYCLDLPAGHHSDADDHDASSNSPTVVVAATAEIEPWRRAPRLIIAAASLLAAGLVALSWSARLLGRASGPSTQGRSAVPSMSTASRSVARNAGEPSPRRHGPLVLADLDLTDAPSVPPRSSNLAHQANAGPPVAPAPAPPPLPGRAGRPDRSLLEPSPSPVPIRLPDIATWTPLVRKAWTAARCWLANVQAVRRTTVPAPPGVPSARPSPPGSSPDLRIGMPDSLELEAGQSLSMPIRVERAGRDEPLVIHFEGLPAGVTICDVSIPAGRNQSRAVARARLDAAAQTVPVAMTISAGSALVRAEFRLQIRANPAMLHRTRGHTLLACGRPAEAIAAFTKALEAGVSDPLVYNNRGMAHFSLNQLDLAIRDYTEASRLSPSDAVIRYNRGVALERRGDDFRALLDFDTAIRLKPDYARAYEARASIYRKQGDLARAGADSGRASALAQATPAEGQPPAPCPPRPHASAGTGSTDPAVNPPSPTR